MEGAGVEDSHRKTTREGCMAGCGRSRGRWRDQVSSCCLWSQARQETRAERVAMEMKGGRPPEAPPTKVTLGTVPGLQYGDWRRGGADRSS